MSGSRHAPRRTPATPSEPLDLQQAADELLAQARDLRAQRSARTLTPGVGVPVKQTLLALVSGQHLEDHPAPGPTTLQAVTGRVNLHHGDHTVELAEGAWTTCPSERHGLEALTDAVVLLTVAPAPEEQSAS